MYSFRVFPNTGRIVVRLVRAVGAGGKSSHHSDAQGRIAAPFCAGRRGGALSACRVSWLYALCFAPSIQPPSMACARPPPHTTATPCPFQDKLSDTYGSPSMDDLQNFNEDFNDALEGARAAHGELSPLTLFAAARLFPFVGCMRESLTPRHIRPRSGRRRPRGGVHGGLLRRGGAGGAPLPPSTSPPPSPPWLAG